MAGKFIIIFGPSGSGKGTVVTHLKSAFPQAYFARSVVSRPMRPGEEEGTRYLFVTKEEFETSAERGDYLEWNEHFGALYGTPASEVLPYLERGVSVIKEMDLLGVERVMAKIPREQLYIVFIHAGSWDAVETRILDRAPLSSEELALRRGHYEAEMAFSKNADAVVVNEEGKIDETLAVFDQLLSGLIH